MHQLAVLSAAHGHTRGYMKTIQEREDLAPVVLWDEGTGLGLSIAQRIVYEHGGRIDVESKFGEGTTFSIYLPVTVEESDLG